jgi:hypothetical protein
MDVLERGKKEVKDARERIKMITLCEKQDVARSRENPILKTGDMT